MRFVPIILLVGVFSCHSAALQSNTASQSPSSLRLATNKLSSNSVQLEIETENLVREQVRCVLNHINHESTLDIRPWKRIYLDLERDMVDGFYLAISRPQLDKFAEISAPLVMENWYWFWRADVKAPETWQQGYKLGSILGSQQEKWLQESGYSISMSASNLPQLIKLLEIGRVDVILVDKDHFNQAVSQTNLSLAKFQSRFFRYVPLGAYFSRNFLEKHPEFIEKFNFYSGECQHQIFSMSEEEKNLLEVWVNQHFFELLKNKKWLSILQKYNSQRKNMDLQDIELIDQKWIEGFKTGNHAILTEQTDGLVIQDLVRIKNESNGVITEIIFTDKQGMNIAVSDMTSDFYQGDEIKFQQSIQLKKDEVFIDQMAYDASTRLFQVNVSFPVFDSAATTQQALGVMILGIDVEKALSLTQ
jgi:hypothetical protein